MVQFRSTLPVGVLVLRCVYLVYALCIRVCIEIWPCHTNEESISAARAAVEALVMRSINLCPRLKPFEFVELDTCDTGITDS